MSKIRNIDLAESESKNSVGKKEHASLRSLEDEFSKTKPFDGYGNISVHLEAKTAYLAKV